MGRALAPRFSRQAPELRRQQIIEAAKRCLAKGGVAAFTVSEIAKEAEISHGLINHYFPAKDQLMAEAYRSVGQQLQQVTRAALGRLGTSNADRLLAIIEATFAPEIFNESYLAIWLALWGQVRTNKPVGEAHHQLYDDYRRRLSRVIAAEASARAITLDAATLARAFTALVDGLWLEWCLDPKVFRPDEAKAICLALLENALGPLGKPAP